MRRLLCLASQRFLRVEIFMEINCCNLLHLTMGASVSENFLEIFSTYKVRQAFEKEIAMPVQFLSRILPPSTIHIIFSKSLLMQMDALPLLQRFYPPM